MNASLDFTPDLPDPRSRPTLDLSGPVPTIDGVPVWPIFGATSPAARYGTMSTGDILDSQVLVSKTVDGVDLGSLWDEFSELLDIYNNPHHQNSATCYGFRSLFRDQLCHTGFRAVISRSPPSTGPRWRPVPRSKPPCWATSSTTTT